MLPLGVLLVASVALPLPELAAGDSADGVSGGGAVLVGAMAVTVVATVAAAAVAGLSRLVPRQSARVLLALAGAVGAGAVAVYVGTVLGTRLAADPGQVGIGWVLPAVPVALVWGWTGYAVHGEHRPALTEVLGQVPERDRVQPAAGDEGERVPLPWTSDTRSPSLRFVSLFAGAVTVAVTVLLLATGEGWLLVVPALLLGGAAAAVCYACIEVTAVVDQDGLRLRSRTLPLTLLRVAAQDVVGAGVADVDPMAWGGVGLRWLPDRTAYTGSGGPGLVVHRRSGRRLAIELVEGQEAATAGARALRAAAQARVASSSPS